MTEKLKNAFQTFPLADDKEEDEASNASIPAEQSVEDVKDWVDDKQM